MSASKIFTLVCIIVVASAFIFFLEYWGQGTAAAYVIVAIAGIGAIWALFRFGGK